MWSGVSKIMPCFNKHPSGSKTDLHCYACRIEGLICCQCNNPITSTMDCESK